MKLAISFGFGISLVVSTLGSSQVFAGITNKLLIEGVTASRNNAVSAGISGYVSCKGEFEGTHHNNTVWISPSASGGSGRYRHTLVWSFGAGYELSSRTEKQQERLVGQGRSYGIYLPKLRDDVPFVQQTVFLISKDLVSGETRSTQEVFTVSRGVIISQSGKPERVAENCFQRYPAFESTVGVLSNGSTNPSSLNLKQGVQRLWETQSGSSWGFYFSPFSWIGFGGVSLGNFLSFHKSHFSTVSKQTIETVEVSSDYSLSPGDFVQIYTQKTRHVTNYDAKVVNVCGKSTEVEGAYKMQWWAFAYHAVPVNPYDESRPETSTVGAKPLNTCPSELNPDSEDGDFEFVQTNL